jgi:hypothetical protein
MIQHWPRPVSTSLTQVKIRGATSWSAVSAIIQKLAKTRGIRAVHPLRANAGRVDLAIDTELSPAHVSGLVKSARIARGSVATAIKDGNVLVKVREDAPAPGEMP